ncbi:hypothetical protein EMA8858_03618 [Emticicia aquatica]|uniref:Anti-sigma factor n=1 Tax=Emticicia aquatica TaxID=1681835 RepID=A0ABN8EWQ5_9BACT|nr:hypothetical protein [Emticicia aquatica]CAH0997485.1 hypothetical protein EMA8858_03618 [Emticicia aquatica]
MKNRLERFVRDNREAFDDHEPSNDLWKKIEKKTVHTKPKSKILNLKGLFGNEPKFALRIAAGLTVFLTIGYFVYNYGKPVSQNADIMVLSPTYAKELTQFASLVEEKREELKELEQEDPQLYHQFDTELTALDQNYQSLKQELPKNPNQEELLKAMIQNLSMQIDLLNQQLQIIQKIKEAKNGKTKTMV